jgi:predicted acyltransferase
MLVLVCLEIVLIFIGAWFAPNVPLAQKSFWTHPMVLLGDEAQVDARFNSFGDTVSVSAR